MTEGFLLVQVCVCTWVSVAWRSEDHLEPVFDFRRVGLGDCTQVVRLGSKPLSPELSHCLLFWDRVSCGVGCPGTYDPAKDGLGLWILSPQRHHRSQLFPIFIFNRENAPGFEPLLGYRIWMELNNTV